MSTKQERQKVRNELVKLARDQGRMNMGEASTREIIDQCMATPDPIASMKLVLENRNQENYSGPEIPPPNLPPELPAVGLPTEETKGGEVPPDGQLATLTAIPLITGQMMHCLPMVESSPIGYQTEHLQLRLTTTQRVNLSQLFHGLRGEHAQMDNGHHVDSAVDAVRWFLEQLPNMMIKAGSGTV